MYLATDESVADDLSGIIIGLTDALERVTAERDALVAVIENAKRASNEGNMLTPPWVKKALAEAPVDALERVTAERDKVEAKLAAVEAKLNEAREFLSRVMHPDRAPCHVCAAVDSLNAALAATGQEGEK